MPEFAGLVGRVGVFSMECPLESLEVSRSVVPLEVRAFSFRSEPLYLCGDPNWSPLRVSGVG
jgi:hypothetical protein